MATELPHICPECGKIASTKEEVEEKFGWRRGNDSQSWCKECREKSRKKSETR